MRQSLVAIFLILFATASTATDFVFETDIVRLAVDAQGHVVSLREKAAGNEWLESEAVPLFAVKKSGTWHASTFMRQEGHNYHVDFGRANVTAMYAITGHKDYIVFELADIQGEGVQAIRLLHLRTKGLATAGNRLAVRWNEQFAISALGLSPRVHSSLGGRDAIAATVYPEFGMLGEKIALVAVPTSRFLDAVQIVEQDFGLPSPTIDGQWAKKSDDIRTSYLFIDLTAWNVDDVIRYAKLGGFKYILIYASTWASSRGSYPIRLRNYPLGERSLKSVVDKIHAAGLKVGIHTLTSFVSKNDPLVRPVPDPRLLKDAEATLAFDLDKKSSEIPVTAPLQNFSTGPSFYGERNAGLDIQINDEIIQCRDIGVSNPERLMRCKRGFAGTKAATHRQGTKIYHLAERHGSYLADLRTSLKGQISERIAGLIDRLSLDMVYFDGGVVNDANGPGWYWVGQQQDDTLRRVERDLLVQGSGWTHWNWHRYARGACDDYAEITTIPYLEHHKIAPTWHFYRNNFMPAELGWWAILNDTADHPATTPEEVEHHAIRMIALDTPISLETTVAKLKANGRAEEMLKTFGKLERLGREFYVSGTTRRRLREGRWHWDDHSRKFHAIREVSSFTTFPGEVNVHNDWETQPLRFRFRVMPSLNEVDDAHNLTLFQPASPMLLPAPDRQAPMPGSLIRRIELCGTQGEVSGTRNDIARKGDSVECIKKIVDLSANRAIAVRVRVAEEAPNSQAPHPVLNVQLESQGRAYRDHYVDLDFVGERTLIIPSFKATRMFPNPKPKPKNYHVKRAAKGFRYREVAAVNLRWMRYPGDSTKRVKLESLEAIAEQESTIINPKFRIGEDIFEVPAHLDTGSYVEFSADDGIRVFDRNGTLVHQSPISGRVPILKTDSNRLEFRGGGFALVDVTVFTMGRSLAED